MVHVYLSGPIIHDELRKDDFFRTIVLFLSSRGISVFAPQFLGPAEPDEIYRRDVEHVLKSNLVIAEVSNPSLGVGMEIMLAIDRNIPLFLFRNREAKPLSKMVAGAPRKVLFEYSTIDEVIQILKSISIENITDVQECPECGTIFTELVEGGKYRCVKCGNEFQRA
ncbi:MAG: nucleoside 2-deoxyribosyltransferase [Candidatus Thorarchaeota archaeon]